MSMFDDSNEEYLLSKIEALEARVTFMESVIEKLIKLLGEPK